MPKKKMLLAAVTDYGRFAAKLKAAVPEMEHWKNLLMSPQYGFPEGRILANSDATKKNIIKGLHWLLEDAGCDDELLFLFVGHGTKISNDSTGVAAILAYPEGGGLADAAIFAKEIEDIRVKEAPPPRTDITYIFETCFAGALKDARDDARDVKALFVEPTRDNFLIDLTRMRPDVNLKFSDLGNRNKVVWRLTDNAELAVPVVLAAAEESEAAFQIQDGYSVRMAFSLRAIDRLYANRDTFDELVKHINPLRKGFNQHAIAFGRRRGEPFPGAPGDPVASSGTAGSAVLEASSTSIQIEFIGLGCFLTPTSPDQRFGNRIVCPLDTIGKDEDRHFAFVEIPEDQLVIAPIGALRPRRYTRDGVRYLRYDLSRHRVLVANAVIPDPNEPPYERSESFENHVPSIPVVCSEFAGKDPADICFLSYPVPTRFTAFFDVYGDVNTCEIQKEETRFVLEYGDVVTWIGHTPLSVHLTIPFTGSEAVVLIDDITNSSTAGIWLKPGATLRAGNARERDITGDRLGDVPPEHFDIMYALAENFPHNPARPRVSFVPVDACSVTKWP